MKTEDAILFLTLPNSAAVTALTQCVFEQFIVCKWLGSSQYYSVIPPLAEGFAVEISNAYLPLGEGSLPCHYLQMWEFICLRHLLFHQLA